MPTIHSKSDPSSGSGIFLKYPRIGGYTVLDHLHEGSHSSIYMARQDRLGRMVAMKLVPEWPPPTDVALERFNRAAYVCAHTPHPGLATLFDVGTRDGYYYATYTFMEGQTLQRHLSTVGPVDESFAIKTAVQVSRTLASLHGNNICHRNVKPKNLFLENNGNVRMIGLGLASCKSAFFSPHLDTHGIGTPHFMAPEMIKNKCDDPRSDLYSLGVTLYVMVSGRPPYDRGIPAVVMSRHLTDTPMSLKELRPDLSSKFVGLVEWLMVKDPAKRLPSAAEAAVMFEELGNKKHSSFWKLSLNKASPPACPTPTPLPVLNDNAALPKIECAAPASPAAPSPKAQHPLAFMWNCSFGFKDSIVLSMLAAVATVALLLSAMYGVTRWMGKRSASAPVPTAPGKAAVRRLSEKTQPVAAPVAVVAPEQVDARMQRDFDHLLTLSNQYQDDPTAGSAAWADFIDLHPQMSREMKTIAEQRLELYQSLKARTLLQDRPRNNEPEF